MYVATVLETEIRLTLEALVDVANGLDEPDFDLRESLAAHEFSRAPDAPDAAMRRAESRLRSLLPLVRTLPDTDVTAATAAVNENLTELPISPSVIDHDGVGLHLHWTPSTAKFDDQLLADLLMALAQELCDNGTARFGRCAADDCQDLFYDGTRNRSKRFCSDPKCASRTHTADHRARRRAAAGG